MTGARQTLARLRPYLAASLLLAVEGTLLFGILHAVLIRPIWIRLFAGLPFAVLASSGITWSYFELRLHGRLRSGIVGGALFGAVIWLALIPVTLFAAALRAFNLRARLAAFESPVELLVAASTGARLGFVASRSMRVSASAAACMTAVLLAMAGPIAVGLGTTQRLLFLGFLPIFLCAGVVAAHLLDRAARE